MTSKTGILPTVEEVPSGFDRVYAEETRQLLTERFRAILIVGSLAYGAFWILDLFVGPEHSAKFLLIRAIAIAWAILSLGVSYTDWGRRFMVPLSVALFVVATLGISAMTVFLGGFTSTYYIGNLMVLFGLGLFLPWRLSVTLTFCGLLMLGYLGLNLIFHGPSLDMLAPTFFLLGTSAFTSLATVMSDRLRRRDLALRLQLEKVNEDLKQLDEAKMRFFANVSHELRTPLTLLFGPLEMLQSEEVSPHRAQLLESMQTNSRRLLRQVNALLDVAKLEAGRLAFEPTIGDLSELLNELVAASAPHAARKGVLLEAKGLEDLTEFAFDYDKVEMIAANLISNAVKFTPKGGRITIRAGSVDDKVAFEVQDTGPGIPEDQLEQIFERFHQVDSSLSREHEGTGLGLSLARELARLSEGDITVRSQVGRGTVFHVELPLEPTPDRPERRRRARRREDQLSQARTDVLAAREYAARSRRETLLADVNLPRLSEVTEELFEAAVGAPRVLLVDDNVDLRTFLASRLSRFYRVETAEDGIAGLDAARRARPDLIVSDIMMPRMDGHEFCRRLRDDPAFANTPIILVTAKTGEEAVVEGLELGADDYVTKPFAMRELEARIAAQLRAKQTERQLHERESRLAAIGQMTSSVVHDLRNPLTLVKGYADLAHALALRGGDLRAIAKEMAKLKEAADRLRRMIEEILDFARSGTSEIELSSVSVAKFLDHTIRSFVTDLADQGIVTRIDLKLDQGQEVSLDQDRIKRVLENLLANAREAVMNTGGPRRILVSGESRDGHLLLRVADSGPGVPEELVDQLFEPFSTAGKKRGTGLGLATVRNLVRAHGGKITVESKAPEGGAAFTVWLPLKREAGTVELAEPASAEA
ncbi:MAG: ATP-binding protein [Thermoanaerobaculia bacterium]